ncbi:hypothetical protein [Pandoravirus japonicus]|uniref:Uncharacterized protein n=1 Tax=Pandoravirus japonicus TaxID=2823154 RepID=A0A811BNV2_9VIRU|nr:hypothetical protein [Pandoravirus japonicus]
MSQKRKRVNKKSVYGAGVRAVDAKQTRRRQMGIRGALCAPRHFYPALLCCLAPFYPVPKDRRIGSSTASPPPTLPTVFFSSLVPLRLALDDIVTGVLSFSRFSFSLAFSGPCGALFLFCRACARAFIVALGL